VLARALAQLRSMPGAPRTTALLADEPTSAMDPRHALEAMAVLRREADLGRAVVVVLHDLTAALRFADRAVVLDATGRVAASGAVREALREPVLREVFDVDFLALRDAAGALTVLVATIPPASCP
jgi:iron complex transport system ATP-binding protein